MNIVAVYNVENGKEKEIEEAIRKVTKNHEGEGIIVGGDFNIRTGELGGDEEEGEAARKSKDKTIGNGGRKLIELMRELGLEILNGRTEGDWEGEYTYIGGRGNTVIDYIFGNERITDGVTEFRVEDRVDSDHMPISLKMETIEDRRGKKRRQEFISNERKGKKQRRN